MEKLVSPLKGKTVLKKNKTPRKLKGIKKSQTMRSELDDLILQISDNQLPEVKNPWEDLMDITPDENSVLRTYSSKLDLIIQKKSEKSEKRLHK